MPHGEVRVKAISIMPGCSALARLSLAISSLVIVPSKGGVFEVTVDGDLIFSKKDLGRHAKAGEVMGLMRKRG